MQWVRPHPVVHQPMPESTRWSHDMSVCGIFNRPTYSKFPGFVMWMHVFVMFSTWLLFA